MPVWFLSQLIAPQNTHHAHFHIKSVWCKTSSDPHLHVLKLYSRLPVFCAVFGSVYQTCLDYSALINIADVACCGASVVRSRELGA